MVCNSYLMSVIVQTGQIGTILTRERLHLRSAARTLYAGGAGLTFPCNCDFRSSTKMMVDSGAPVSQGPVVHKFPEKDAGGYVSGGWKSEDGKLSYGYSSFRGKRVTMEDCYDIKTSKINGQTVCLFGIFYGETYQQTDADFLDSGRDPYRDDGSTASTAVLVGNHLSVANVGDSRTIISKAGKAIPLSEDHKPNRSDERKRI